jgi:hypothetical protein
MHASCIEASAEKTFADWIANYGPGDGISGNPQA